MKKIPLSKRHGVPAVLAVLTAGTACATTLIMLPSVETRGPQVLLREIVSNHDSLPTDWGERAVLPAPEPGKVERLSISAIAYALQQYPDMSDVTLRGTYNTTVRRASIRLESARLAQAVEDYVGRHEDWQGEDAQLLFDTLDNIDNLPPGRLGVRVNEHTMLPGRDGRARFNLTVTSDERPARRLDITARILVMRRLWTATRPLRRGQILTSDDLHEFTAAWHPQSPGVPVEEDITGYELSRNVKAGQPVYRHLLLEPICARNGDQISVFAQQGGMEITMLARALSNGRRGDRIMCMNENSQRRLLARLTGIRTAVVETPTLSMKGTRHAQ